MEGWSGCGSKSLRRNVSGEIPSFLREVLREYSTNPALGLLWVIIVFGGEEEPQAWADTVSAT